MATVIDFTKAGGMHFAQNDLAKMQEAYREGLSAIAHLCGNLVILYGMVDNGSSYSPGAVAINGEILPFSGGGKMPNITIQETKSGNTFRDGVVKETHTLRKVVTTSVGGYALSSFTRLNEIKNKANLVNGKVPIGELPAMNTYLNKGSQRFFFNGNSSSFDVPHSLNTDDYRVIGTVHIISTPHPQLAPHPGVSFYIKQKQSDKFIVMARIVGLENTGINDYNTYRQYYFDYILV